MVTLGFKYEIHFSQYGPQPVVIYILYCQTKTELEKIKPKTQTNWPTPNNTWAATWGIQVWASAGYCCSKFPKGGRISMRFCLFASDCDNGSMNESLLHLSNPHQSSCFTTALEGGKKRSSVTSLSMKVVLCSFYNTLHEVSKARGCMLYISSCFENNSAC